MTTWHASDATLRDWVDGAAGQLVSTSVEQHLVHCERCRGLVAALVPADDLESGWEAILDIVERPQRSALERCLHRLGLPPSDTMVIASAPVLRTAWVAALIAMLSFALVAATAGRDGGLVVFLGMAPLIPVAGVAVAYGPSADPAYESVLVTPYPMFRLVLLRTAAVLVASVPLIIAAGLLLPISTGTAVAWLVPAAGFTVAVLTTSAWVDPEYGAIAIGLGWIVAVAWAARTGDPLTLLAPSAMAGYLVVFAVGLAILVRRVFAATPSWRLL
jgi:hypothetical protein